MYESPININCYGKMEVQLEGEVLRAVQEVGVSVDKDELLAALSFDRNQYFKGYQDALREDDVVRVVRCRDCVYNENGCCTHSEYYDDTRYRPDYFCADGERKYDE